MPTVTKSSRPRIVSRHLDAPTVEPVNAKATKAHYVGKRGFLLAQWAPVFLFCVLILTAAHGFLWVQQTIAHAAIGERLCTRPLLALPEYHCEGMELDCATNREVQAVRAMESQVRDHNAFQAANCIRVI
jgi:hypothetical protein